MPSPRPSPGGLRSRPRGIVGRARHRGTTQALVDPFALDHERGPGGRCRPFVTVVGAVGEIDTGIWGSASRRRRPPNSLGSRPDGPHIARIGDPVGTDQRQHRQLSGTGLAGPTLADSGTTGWQLLSAVCIRAGVAGAVAAAAGLRTKQGRELMSDSSGPRSSSRRQPWSPPGSRLLVGSGVAEQPVGLFPLHARRSRGSS